MIKPIFNRYERKYILSNDQKNELQLFLKKYMIDDEYSKEGKAYTIYNIYFDTSDYNIIRNSISKPKYKDKLRLRSYKCPLEPTDMVFLEIKKKYDGRVNKRRINITYQVAIDYLEKGIIPHFNLYMDEQVFLEIDYFIKIHKAKPGAFISYERTALISTSEELRITFDHEILFRKQDVTLNQSGGLPIMDNEDTWLMEVKSNDNFPLWLAQKLSSFALYSQGFSKYGTAYKQLLLGGTTDDYILYDY
ncbi:MAG: polyphosphate polymerase domain-containing protein [Firmicutes bacterium]|nr:polyphosphate polymerase domain-containing protein [Bacillota bacterium]